MDKKTKIDILKIIGITIIMFLFFYTMNNTIMKDKSLITQDGIRCEYGRWSRCGYYLYNCEDGKEYKCATNIQKSNAGEKK